MIKKKIRPFLKWAGGKFRLVETLQQYLPESDTLVEPFVGAGALFLNSDYPNYILGDINEDLINLYRVIQSNADGFIEDARTFFVSENNTTENYQQLRQQFNNSQDSYERSLLFLYLNKHGYNGLCRYNKSGGFNVPFGRFKAVSFPEHSILHFAEKAQRARFFHSSFEQTFTLAPAGSVIYCDPPYLPISDTANFTDYAKTGFNLDQQKLLGKLASTYCLHKGMTVLVSNHDTPVAREIYADASLHQVQVKRHISQDINNRKVVAELMALFQAKKTSR
jgi:DNA adenine methylase